MSDLATSCEYHTPEATCLAVDESPKAKANRQQRCKNEQKQTCCYTCIQRRECTINCKYLGSEEAPPKPQEPQPQTPKPEAKPAPDSTPKNVQAAYCTSCNIEMAPKKAKIRIDPEDNKQFGEYTPQTVDSLPVIVYLCPLCGRIEFRAAK